MFPRRLKYFKILRKNLYVALYSQYHIDNDPIECIIRRPLMKDGIRKLWMEGASHLMETNIPKCLLMTVTFPISTPWIGSQMQSRP